MDAINVGPFAVPAVPLLLFGSAWTSLAVAQWMKRRKGVVVEPSLWKIIIAGILVARFVFVAAYFDAYMIAPWTMLDIRDGGFNAPAGIAASVALTAWMVWRQRELRKGLVLSVMAGALVWALGTVAVLGFSSDATQIPDVALNRLDGRPVHLQSLPGKPVIVNMWATWCPPCRREMPVFRDAQLVNKDIVFVFVNQGESVEKVRQYLQSENLRLENVLLDPAGVLAKKLGSVAMPTTFFFNDKGRLVDKRTGEVSAATLTHRIESLRHSSKQNP